MLRQIAAFVMTEPPENLHTCGHIKAVLSVHAGIILILVYFNASISISRLFFRPPLLDLNFYESYHSSSGSKISWTVFGNKIFA